MAFHTGPLLGATADLGGYRILFDPEGFPDPGCEFGCKAKIGVAAAAVWTLALALFGVFGE